MKRCAATQLPFHVSRITHHVSFSSRLPRRLLASFCHEQICSRFRNQPPPLSRHRRIGAGCAHPPHLLRYEERQPARSLRPHHDGRGRLGHDGPRQHRRVSGPERSARWSPPATWTRSISSSALDKVNGHYRNKDCKPYHDYREMMARKDIDAVMLAVPDHWHALIAVDAAKNQKDIYGEKPLARTIAEQQAIVKAVQKNKRIWQTGSWQRSQAPFRKACEIVRNGLIGKVTRVEVGLPSGHYDFAGTAPAVLAKFPGAPKAPEYLAKVVPGSPDWKIAVTPPPARAGLRQVDRALPNGAVHPGSRAHELALELQHRRRPVARLDRPSLRHRALGDGHGHTTAHRRSKATASSRPPMPSGTPAPSTASNCKYPKDITMIIAGGHPEIRGGTKWIGTDGWVWVDRGGYRRLQHRLVRADPRRPIQGEALQLGQPPPQLH